VDLAVCDNDAEALSLIAPKVEGLGRKIVAVRADVLVDTEIAEFFAILSRQFTTIDILVNVAGGVSVRSFVDTTPEHWAHDIQRNFRYVLQSVQLSVPLMRSSGRGGSIINFSTIEAHRGAASIAVYAGAKAALENFSRAIAVELGSERIRVNVIAPDQTPSRGNWSALSSVQLQGIRALPPEIFDAAWKMYIPMNKPPPPLELGNAVLFLASELSAYVTGITLHVDGGCRASMGINKWPFGDGWAPLPFGGSANRLFGKDATAPDV
jgi:NAD(P)-dependent dehydrogenase (short-subunit alcohol dehydrogenase family)